MRMALCWPSLILLIFAFSTFTSAAFTLTPDVTKFVPTCAQDCFISFLNANFDNATCGTASTLDCLCSHNTTTGYTVGEGAVQCILSEDNVRFCQGNDAESKSDLPQHIIWIVADFLQDPSSLMHSGCVLGKQTLSRILMPRLLQP